MYLIMDKIIKAVIRHNSLPLVISNTDVIRRFHKLQFIYISNHNFHFPDDTLSRNGKQAVLTRKLQ